MARRLKVFEARIGFYDTVVAVPSRAAALRAWGVHQDLFQDGQARESDDAAAVAAAMAIPGVVLRRPAGAKGDFERDPAPPPKPPARRKASVSKHAAPIETPPPPPPPPDRGALDKAEKALAKLQAAEDARIAGLERRRAALDDEIRAVRDDFATRRRAAEEVVSAARKAWRRAGGK